MYYVIQVKTGKEKETMEDILKHQRGDFHLEVFSPCRKTMRKYKGVYKEVTERCFPGYLFVETNDVEQLFKDLYWVPGYTKLLGREGLTYNFVPLNEEESRMIDILYNADSGRTTPISDIEVVEGDQIRILTGPLKGIEGTIVKTNLHKRSVIVGFYLCGQYVEVKVGINIVSKT